MHSVFRIGDIQKLDKKSPLYEVELKLTSDDDQQLRQLTDHIRKEVNGTGWYRLEQASNDSGKAYIYHMLGMMKNGKGQYTEAASFYEMFLRIKRKTLPEDHPSLANIYNNIGGV
ncbi:unnamed protein product, partial [Rotaria sordida]